MKKQTGAASVTITPAIISQVEDVLAQAAKHKYQASKVYAAHNAVFGLNETPEVCASCNKKRGDALKRWYQSYQMEQINKTNAQANAEGQLLTGNEVPNVDTGANVSRETISDLQAIYDKFITEDAPQGEADGIAWIMQGHAKELNEEEALLLSDRLAEITDGRRSVVDIYSAYLDTEEPEDEAAAITEILSQDDDAKESGLSMLLDSERELLQNHLAELDNPHVSDEDKAALEAAQNMEDEDAPLDLKNKKGEYFQANFISEDGVNGQLLDLEGNSLKPGTYSTELGDSYAVQPGGKATYKSDII